MVVVGAHPDDPESGCGGTMALYAEAGWEVVALYLTRGEAGISGRSHQEAAEIRTAEAQKACEILGARAVFAGQIDGAAEVTNETYEKFLQILEAEKPAIVLTHWPVDSHRDHRAASLLTYDAWLRLKRGFTLYYYEVETGEQSQQYCPTDYVDITRTEAKKHAATFAHASQHPDEFYKLHDLMNRFRGMEFGCRYAEAFMRHPQGRSEIDLPIMT
jgi:LmbE family N-acetylglucosaminyl deacetylase